jgi:hypothetical protein
MDPHFFRFPLAVHLPGFNRQDFVPAGHSIPACISIPYLDRLPFSVDFSFFLRDFGYEKENKHHGHENRDYGRTVCQGKKGRGLAFSKPDRSGWNAGNDRIGRKGLCDYCTCADHTSFSQGNSIQNDNRSSQPAVLLDDDASLTYRRLEHDRDIRPIEAVIPPGNKITLPRQKSVFAHFDLGF